MQHTMTKEKSIQCTLNISSMKFLLTLSLFFIIGIKSVIAQDFKPNKQDIQKAAYEALERLTIYINYFGETETTESTKSFYLDAIIDEFEPNATMQVSNKKNNNKTTMSVKDYFSNLITLRKRNNYSKVIFSFKDLEISEVKPSLSKNKWIAMGKYTQIFNSYGSGTSYHDVTEKITYINIYIIVQSNTFKIKFGDTKVISTH
jgi:hypothetical protein